MDAELFDQFLATEERLGFSPQVGFQLKKFKRELHILL